MMDNICVIPEFDNGKIKQTSFGMITGARKDEFEIFALVSGADTDIEAAKNELQDYGVTKIINIRVEPCHEKNPAVFAAAASEIISEYSIARVFGLSSALGREILPRIAAALDAPLVMDCFYVDHENNRVKTSKYSGKAIATLELKGEVSIMGIRPNAVDPQPVPVKICPEIIAYDAGHVSDGGLRLVSAGGREHNKKINLAEADVVISGGRGMQNSENFDILFRCAEKLNAAVGASRVAVDSGWVPYSMQVGQTGEKVSPKVYIACGISGSIQHFAGMKTSQMIIAVNTDENAAIMSNCDYFIKGDALEIIPELTRCLEKDDQ